MKQLASQFRGGQGGYAGAYLLRSLAGEDKYFLVMVTGHHKGFVLASDIIYGIEETYQREVQEYKDRQPRQLAFGFLNPATPTPEEIFESKVDLLKEDIWQACQGKTMARLAVHAEVMPRWFGLITKRHVTATLKALQSDGRITQVTGALSGDETLITFCR